MTRYLSAKAAAAELGVSPATLYAYVSRGMIRSEATGEDHRARRYNAEDVQKLKTRKESRQHPEVVAESALHLGTPVMESAITLITEGRLYYRGQDALQLAVSETLERVAALIWRGDLNADIPTLHTPLELPPRCLDVLEGLPYLSHVQRFQVLLPLLSADDLAAYDLRPEGVVETGARILRSLTLIAADLDKGKGSITDLLCQGWRLDDRAASCLNAALILCADHELNASSFTARCVASTNATPYAAVQAGLAAVGGSKHGGHTERVAALLREAGNPIGVYPAMVRRLRRGETVSGFGHPLYPEGDPRGRELLRLVMEAYPESGAAHMAEVIIESGQRLLGEAPTIDMGLVILVRALGLPEDTALTLFALGRTVGWIGHTLEQYEVDRIIRPRARYVGITPTT